MKSDYDVLKFIKMYCLATNGYIHKTLFHYSVNYATLQLFLSYLNCYSLLAGCPQYIIHRWHKAQG